MAYYAPTRDSVRTESQTQIDVGAVAKKYRNELWVLAGGVGIAMMVLGAVAWEKLGIGDAIRQNSPNSRPQTSLMVDLPQVFTPPITSAARIENPGNQAVVDAFDKGIKEKYGMLLQMTFDPEFKTGKPLNDLVAFDRAREIIENYEKMVTREPMANIIKDFDRQSIPAIDRTMQSVLKTDDFKSGLYPNLYATRNNIVYVQSAERFGGGFSFSPNDSSVAVIFGDYEHFPPEIIRANVAQVRAHENLIHPIAGLLKTQAEPKGQEQNYSDISHASFGIAEDISRLAMGVNEIPNPRIVEAILMMEKGGMSKGIAIKTMLRIGFGVTGDISKAVVFYDKGRENKGSSFYELLTGKQPPGKLVSKEEVDSCRTIWAKIGEVSFTPIRSYGDIYSPADLTPPGIAIDDKMVDVWSKAKGFDFRNAGGFAKDFWGYWNGLGRPKAITPKQWEIFVKSFKK